MCGLGRLYSKQNVIEQLLDKTKEMPDIAKHIKSLKDIKTLKLTRNPAYKEENKGEGSVGLSHSPYICKLIGLEMSGKFRFIALWSCGCLMSERALKEIKSSANACPLCQTPYEIQDVIVLNGSDEDIELMQLKIDMRNAKRKASKQKDKKNKSNAAELDDLNKKEITTCANDLPSTSKTSVQVNHKEINSIKTEKCTIGKSNLVARIKRTTDKNETLDDPEIKRLKTDYSVSKDPKATDVYKSLFTTHKSEKEQLRAHWVTYNPFYN